MVLPISLSILILLTGALDIVADLRGRRRWVYLLKPLTMVWALLLALAGAIKAPGGYGVLILVGLAFSLVGDVFLMLERDRFLAGLAAFLAAHIVYIVAFVREAPMWGPIYTVLPFAFVLIGMLQILWPHTGTMRLPVGLYALVITTMAWRAWARWATLGSTGALLAAIGAVLFVASDSFLAYNRFVRPLPKAPAWVLSTYFYAQWLIALSVWG
ncbi:MAG: lysoplasmalogenase [Chloroflexi bacterium]|nr:lysoplasmalogenase [Chloroflexota bacterium]